VWQNDCLVFLYRTKSKSSTLLALYGPSIATSVQLLLMKFLISLSFSTASVLSFQSILLAHRVSSSIMSSIYPGDIGVPPPIVYTIAGSDSGGGAGIQADLSTIRSFGGHGCSAITCLTAQNSQGVTAVHNPPSSFLRSQLDALLEDLPPRAIKIGMIGTRSLAETIGSFLKEVQSRLEEKNNSQENFKKQKEKIWIVLDPVMISTSGHKLIDDEAKEAIIEHIFPLADIVTPNKYEAEALLGRELLSPEDVEQGAKDILAMGVKSVLIKGGHSLLERRDDTTDISPDVTATLGYAQDYYTSSLPSPDPSRLCDGGVWIRSDRYDTVHTHGTGCTLSSAIASALALGHVSREKQESESKEYYFSLRINGATSAIQPIDACCLAKAYVSAGIARGMQLGRGPGPVVHTQFPSTSQHFPRILSDPSLLSSGIQTFRSMNSFSSASPLAQLPSLGRILPVVDSICWVKRLIKHSEFVTDIQLRIKDTTDLDEVRKVVRECQVLCDSAGIRLWINDYWEVALEIPGCFGVHLGQEDLARCQREDGLRRLHERHLALGVSTHSYAELAAALAVNPTYISIGPIFMTSSKNVAFNPQGLAICQKWRQLVPENIPLVVIGGINDPREAKLVRDSGADCIAIIGAITNAVDIGAATSALCDAMA
jgi:hydroxymethylpyrimidine kinase / phosphomethylpyrimidine kinase / thiamine-phosphate diphosphorylase